MHDVLKIVCVCNQKSIIPNQINNYIRDKVSKIYWRVKEPYSYTLRPW